MPDRSLTYTKYGECRLPSQPTWFHRLEEILSTLRTLEASHLDRHAVEHLFGVGQRRARQLMTGLPCIQLGNAVAVNRLALIDRLENTAKGDPFQWERSRRARVADSLEAIRKDAAARRILIPAAPDSSDRLIRDVIPGVELARGELRVLFDGAEDLASKLFALSQAMANDWDEFSQLVEN